jgi:hypothetical protein
MSILSAGDRFGIGAVGLLVFAALFVCEGLQGQEVSDAKGRVVVPLVGCRSDGQTGPIDAPESGTLSVGISRTAGQNLAYYKAVSGVGVLAPRGWHCFRTYGSAVETLYVSAEAIDTSGSFSDPKSFNGPAIQLSYISGDGSGSISVAEIVARVFPAYRSQAVKVMNGFDVPERERMFGPYPKDMLTYRSKKIVEFKTPANAEGLGTRLLPKSDSAIRGVAMLAGQAPDLLHLSVRLPAAMTRYASAIIKQLEFDAAHLKSE